MEMTAKDSRPRTPVAVMICWSMPTTTMVERSGQEPLDRVRDSVRMSIRFGLSQDGHGGGDRRTRGPGRRWASRTARSGRPRPGRRRRRRGGGPATRLMPCRDGGQAREDFVEARRPLLFPAEDEHGERPQEEDRDAQGELEADVGDGRPGAEDHGPDVDGRGGRAQAGDDEQDGRDPLLGDAEAAEGQGHGGADDEQGDAPGPGQGAGDEDDDHQDEKGDDPGVGRRPAGSPGRRSRRRPIR